eukprot:365219-Chlamydomonas_euryale.AAC.31
MVSKALILVCPHPWCPEARASKPCALQWGDPTLNPQPQSPSAAVRGAGRIAPTPGALNPEPRSSRAPTVQGADLSRGTVSSIKPARQAAAYTFSRPLSGPSCWKTIGWRAVHTFLRNPPPSSPPPHFLCPCAAQEEFLRWEALTLQKALDRMQDITYCPRCQAVCCEVRGVLGPQSDPCENAPAALSGTVTPTHRPLPAASPAALVMRRRRCSRRRCCQGSDVSAAAATAAATAAASTSAAAVCCRSCRSSHVT